MTPQLEEALRLLRLRPLTPYAVDFRYDDEVVSLLSETDMRSIVSDLLDFASEKLNAP